jgi:hypothetical protein
MKKQAFLVMIMLAVFSCAWAQDPVQLQSNTTLQAPPRVFITVTAPNGGEQVLRGAQQTIQWTASADIGRPTIEIKKGGAVIRTFALVSATGPFDGNKWRWTWNVPAAADLGLDYRVRVVSENGRSADESNHDFAVVSSKIEVYMPRAGEHFRRGSTMTVHFRCFNITQNVRVFQDGYATYPIAENVAPGRGIVEWRNVGGSVEGDILFPTGNAIVVATMDGTVRGYSQPYILDER